MIGRRRFVNLVAEHRTSAMCSVHRLNVAEHLFYPSTAEAEAVAKPELSKLRVLPAPAVSFQATPGPAHDEHLVALVSPRRSESRFLWRSPSKTTLLCDLDSRNNHHLPGLRCKGRRPITISIARPGALEEDLYVMSSIPRPSAFEVLRFGPHNSRRLMPYPEVPPEIWQWDPLPPPPLPTEAELCPHHMLPRRAPRWPHYLCHGRAPWRRRHLPLRHG
ncbi:hypothetical protein BS78_01G281300 [Paspalum vaginatum]|nr:hypothetical protein BS78_01G281300 [Paspalum vaginatum]